MPSPRATFIEELRRRRVFRVAAFYGGIAFVIVQIIDGTFEVMGIPAWVSRLMIIVLAVGFPISMILAWVFDITPEGIVRTEGRATGKPGTSNSALIAVTIAAIAFGIWGRWGRAGGDDLPVIAVLPFQSYSEDESDWFADGFTDVLTSQLAKLSEIGVIARTSTMHYKQTDLTASEVGRELGATVVLEGSILRDRGKVRIVGQLIDTRTDRHIWSETYERRLDDAIALQSDVAHAIAQALKDRLTPEEAREMAALPTANADAYEHYLKALSLEQNLGLHPAISPANEIELRETIIMELEAAITLDPALAEAHAKIVQHHGLLYSHSRDQDARQDRLALLTQSLNRAESSAPDTGPVRMARGIYHFLYNREYRRALEYFEPLLALAPSDPKIMAWVGDTYRRVGRWDEGLELLVKAADLNPRDADLATTVLETYRMLHRYEEAERYFNRLKFMGATERYATRAWMAFEKSGDLDRAWNILQVGLKELGPGSLDFEIWVIAMHRDDFESAMEAVRGSQTLSPTAKLYRMMWIHLSMGQMASVAEAGRDYLNIVLNDSKQLKDHGYYQAISLAAAFGGNSTLATQWADTAAMLMNPAIDAVDGPFHLPGVSWSYFIRGDLERGLDFLEESQAHPNNHTMYDMQYIHVYDVVRDHPRFIALMERLKGGR